MIRGINIKTLSLVLLVVIVLPFIINSFYSFPSADDFCLASVSMNHNLWDAQVERYQNWTGRYFASFLLSLNPLIFESILLYQLFSLIMLLGIILGFYSLINTVFNNLGVTGKLALMVLVVLLYLYQLPDISQGFYWLPGSVSYQLANILFLLFLVTTIKYYGTGKSIFSVLSALILLFIIGLNETSMLVIVFFVLTLLIYELFVIKRRISFAVTLFLIAITCSLVVVLSPGNAIRQEYFPDRHQLFYSTYRSLLAALINTVSWLPFILLIILIIFSTSSPARFHSPVFKVKPFLIVILILFILFAGFFPAFWSMGISPPTRTINITYFYFTLLCLHLAFVLNQYFTEKNIQFISFSPITRTGLGLILLLTLMNGNNIRTAYGDLILGRSAAYYETLKERHETLINSNAKTFIVPPLTTQPKTIFFDDITSDKNYWINKCVANYYNVESIAVDE